jgi:hypothetical protein
LAVASAISERMRLFGGAALVWLAALVGRPGCPSGRSPTLSPSYAYFVPQMLSLQSGGEGWTKSETVQWHCERRVLLNGNVVVFR